MKWALYYFTHAFANALRKLFGSVAAIIVVCTMLFTVLIAVICGIIGVAVKNSAKETPPEESGISESVVTETAVPPTGGTSFYEQQLETDTRVEEADLQNAETEQNDPKEKAARLAILELIIGIVILFCFALGLYNSDKQGPQIFQMADATFLFSAPIRPQAVLLFRVVMQMGVSLLGSLYIMGQIPNLIIRVGLSPLLVVCFILVWFASIMLEQMVMVWGYVMAADHPSFRKFVRPAILCLFISLVPLYVFRCYQNGGAFLESAEQIFNAPWTRWIPLLGWLKGIIMFAAEGKPLYAILCAAGCLLLTPLLVRAIWRMKADFYENALDATIQRTERLEQAKSGKTKHKDKEKQESHSKYQLAKGIGAQMFFFHPMLTRKRTSKFGFLTSTCILYLIICSLVGYLMHRFVADPIPIILLLVLLVLLFIRNLANPLEEETNGIFFYIVPEPAFKKSLASILAGTANTAMDMAPGLLVAAILMRCNPLVILGELCVLLCFDFFLSGTGLLVSWILPFSIPKQIRFPILLCLRMMLLVPCVLLVVFGLVFHQPVLFLGLGAAFEAALGGCAIYLAALLIERGE